MIIGVLKGFYRKDHLRKHTRSHIARRVKAELCQGEDSSPPLATPPAPAPAPEPSWPDDKNDLMTLIAAAKDVPF